ncbi:MAG: helix-turn-helix domain-containing protein [Trueperaceae bacterium]
MITKSTLNAWDKFMVSSQHLLRPIENDKHYDEVAAFLDELLEKEESSRSTGILIDYVTQLISEYDEKLELPESEPSQVLAFLMEQHNLKQKDLAHLIPQAVVSQLLNGKRSFSATHAKVLGSYFKVSPEAFL